MTVSDLLEQPYNKSDNAIKLAISCYINSLFQTCYNNWEQAVRTQLVCRSVTESEFIRILMIATITKICNATQCKLNATITKIAGQKAIAVTRCDITSFFCHPVIALIRTQV
jgi:hypothetical protein